MRWCCWGLVVGVLIRVWLVLWGKEDGMVCGIGLCCVRVLGFSSCGVRMVCRLLGMEGRCSVVFSGGFLCLSMFISSF